MLHQKKEKIEDRWFSVIGQNLHSVFIANDSVRKSLPVIMISGLGVSSSYMIPSAIKLANNADVYCPDLPGFGKSSKPDHVLNISELSDSLAAFMSEIKIRRATLIGHSFGCQIIAEFALQYPEKLERLVLAAPSGDPNITSGFRYLGKLMRDTAREPFSLIPLAVRDYLTAGLIRGMKTFRFALEDNFEEKLPEIKAPTLVIRGARDPIVSRNWAEKVAKLLPQGKLVSISGAAHAVNYSSPGKFVRAIEDFLVN